MKILLNGFEFEIMSDDTQVTIKVTDAEGTELSNNTYTQKTASDEVKPAQMPSVQGETEPQAQAQVQPVAADESLIPSLESIKNKDFKLIKEGLATISDYMKSRQYNQKLYSRLLAKLEEIIQRHLKEYPTLSMEISMSAKYQTPYVAISTDEGDYEHLGHVESDVFDAIDEVGFTQTETDEAFGSYLIYFQD